MIAIIKYNAGNIRSVENAIQVLGYQTVVSDDFDVLRNAEKVIFPGVGEASSAMQNLREKGLDSFIPTLQQPVLGICVGLQLMCRYSEEGNTTCMGIFDTDVKLFPKSTEKVPHVGWNNLYDVKSEIGHLSVNPDVYFVHSYYAELCDNTVATCDYILPFSAILQKNNFYAMQFHVEKSASIGAILLQKFLSI